MTSEGHGCSCVERLGKWVERPGEHVERLGNYVERLGECVERLGEYVERLVLREFFGAGRVSVVVGLVVLLAQVWQMVLGVRVAIPWVYTHSLQHGW